MSAMQVFSPDASLLAVVSRDNRIVLWDVAANAVRQEYVHPDHLSVGYTCLAWMPAPAQKKGKRRLAGGRLALGTESGSVVVWALDQGAVERTLETGRARPVTDVVFSAAGDLLYAASEGKHVFEFQVATGELQRKLKGQKHGVRRLGLLARQQSLVLAGARVSLLDLGTGERQRRFDGGHAAAAAHLAVDGAAQVVASAAADDRFVNLYQLADADASAAAHALPVEGTVASVTVTAADASGKRGKGPKAALVCATTTEGGVFTWRVEGRQVQGARVLGAAQALAAAWVGEGRLLLARGTATQPAFETLDVQGDDGDVRDVEVEALDDGEPGGELSGGQKQKKKKAKAVAEDVHVGSRGAASMAAPTQRTSSDSEGSGSGSGSDDDDDDEEMELPLAERVQALAAAFDEEAARAAAEEEAAEVRKRKASSVASAGSLVSLLEQALQAKDDALLETCLASSDPKIVGATVSRLQSTRVLALLSRLVDKLERRPVRGAVLATWIRAALTHHTGFLMSVPDLVKSLAHLYQTIDSRIAVFGKLVRLSGRLELVLEQLSKRHDAAAQPPQAKLVFDEGAASGSEGEGESGESEEDDL